MDKKKACLFAMDITFLPNTSILNLAELEDLNLTNRSWIIFTIYSFIEEICQPVNTRDNSGLITGKKEKKKSNNFYFILIL